MSTQNTNSTTNNKPKTKIVLQRVLEINDSLKLHLYGTQLILEAGLMLNLPQITISKAQIIYHRFYYKHNRDLTDYPPFHIAMTSTYLASKLDENTRRHRDVLTVFDRLYKKRNNNTNSTHIPTIDPHGKRYGIWKENLFNFEIRILAAMGFNCNIEGSHKYLLQLLVDLLATESLAKDSWALLNDLHRIPLILNYSELQVACSCIFLSARRLKIKLPDDPCWSDLFGVNRYKLHEIASIILELLELPKYAFKLPSQYKEDNETLDCNPATVKQQLKVIHKRQEEKHKRMKKAAKLKKKYNTAPVKSSSNGNNKVMITKLVTVPKPTLGLKTGANGSIKQINLSNMGKLTPPNVNNNANIHFASKHTFDKNEEDKKEKDKDRDRDRARKSYKRDRDRDRRHRRHKYGHRSRRSSRRRRSSSSDSDYHRRRSSRRRDRDRKRDRDRRDRSSSYMSDKSDKSDNKRSRSRSKSKQIDNKKKEESDGENV